MKLSVPSEFIGKWLWNGSETARETADYWARSRLARLLELIDDRGESHCHAHTPRVAYTLEAAEETLAQQGFREGSQLLITPPSGATLTLYCGSPKYVGRRQTGCTAPVTPSSVRAHRRKLEEVGLAAAMQRGVQELGVQMPGFKKILKAGRSDLCGGIAHPKILFCLFFNRGYYCSSASTSDQRRLEKGTS
jgi:hypothetical protein